MTPIRFIKILIRNLKYIIILPMLTGGLMYFITKNQHSQYAAETTLFTGITSNSGLEIAERRIDNIATQSEFNNIISILKSTSLKEEVALRLFTQHMLLDAPSNDQLSSDAYAELQRMVPQDVKQLFVKNNFELSYQNLRNYIRQDENNFVYSLLNKKHPHYSTHALSKIKSDRVSGSDLIRIYFESNDPGVAFQTLRIITEVFDARYSVMKSNQSSSAVEYFERLLSEISEKLNTAEENLLRFNIENSIINYDEQTEQVTTQQEKIDIRLQEAKMDFYASQSVLVALEAEVQKRFNINLRNKQILDMRAMLISYNNELENTIVRSTSMYDDRVVELRRDIAELENRLQNKVDSIYLYESNSQGIEAQNILSEWLQAVKNLESYSAQYLSMKERREEFNEEFKRYAPLGALLKRYEREINVHEREYLSVLNLLGVARQKEQNTSMTAQMTVMDAPQLPIMPLPSKKHLYVVITIIFTIIFYILALIIIDMLDRTLKSPARLQKMANLNVLSAMCSSNHHDCPQAIHINERAGMYLFESIRTLSAEHSERPFVIQLFSHQDIAGKTLFAEHIHKTLKSYGYSSLILNIKDLFFKEDTIETQTGDLAREAYLQSTDYTELKNRLRLSKDFIISILPSAENGFENPVLLSSAHLNLLVFDAATTWTEADNYHLDKIKRFVKQQLHALLANAHPEDIEEMYGEINKKRSKLRIFIKKLFKRFANS